MLGLKKIPAYVYIDRQSTVTGQNNLLFIDPVFYSLRFLVLFMCLILSAIIGKREEGESCV